MTLDIMALGVMLSIMTIIIMALSKMKLTIVTLGKGTFRLMTLHVMTFNKMKLITVILRIRTFSIMTLCITTFSVL
jgi:hypothetical protein